jgi:hypothetical protein
MIDHGPSDRGDVLQARPGSKIAGGSFIPMTTAGDRFPKVARRASVARNMDRERVIRSACQAG